MSLCSNVTQSSLMYCIYYRLSKSSSAAATAVASGAWNRCSAPVGLNGSIWQGFFVCPLDEEYLLFKKAYHRLDRCRSSTASHYMRSRMLEGRERRGIRGILKPFELLLLLALPLPSSLLPLAVLVLPPLEAIFVKRVVFSTSSLRALLSLCL